MIRLEIVNDKDLVGEDLTHWYIEIEAERCLEKELCGNKVDDSGDGLVNMWNKR